jgi:quercetin dioxygenase-like cupin family protein
LRYCSAQCHIGNKEDGEARQINHAFRIEEETLVNEEPIKVLYNDGNVEMVVEHLSSMQQIDYEIHPSSTQLIRIEQGDGMIFMKMNGGTMKHRVSATPDPYWKESDLIMIPAGVEHKVVAANQGLKFYATYSPPRNRE